MRKIKLENVSKKFTLIHQRDRTNKGLFSASFPGQKVATEFWALKDINMEVEEGKVFGIIGRNGAGKSTLLNILAGISVPTSGKVEINGKVSSILTLGAGFHDELSGRENIYLNSSILNISRDEINKKYRSIVEFSELDGFLNYPLKAYSQGMRLRLGFSVAVHLDFDILLVDEIFSVGDVAFQKKCFDKIEEYRKEGKTMVITSQSLDVIDRICEEVILLENGEIIQKGSPQKAIAGYLEVLEKKKLSDTFKQRYCTSRWWADKRSWDNDEGSKEARITGVSIYNFYGQEIHRLRRGDKLKVKIEFVVKEEISDPHFGVAIFREDGVYCYGPNTQLDGYRIDKLRRGQGFFSIEFKSLCLGPGKYRLSIAIWDKNELWAYHYHAGCYKFEIVGENKTAQLLDLKYICEPDKGQKKFKIFNFKEPDLFLDFDHHQNQVVVSDIEISSIDLSDVWGRAKDSFSFGEDVKIHIKLELSHKPLDYYIWIGLFRNDDVYCHGVSKKLRAEEITLTYPELPLLTGEYYFSIGIWGKDHKRPLLYQHKAAVFSMSFIGEDHGTVFLEHSWKMKLP